MIASEVDGGSVIEPLRVVVQRAERQSITAALERTRGNITQAAGLLGVNRVQLQRKMTQLGLR